MWPHPPHPLSGGTNSQVRLPPADYAIALNPPGLPRGSWPWAGAVRASWKVHNASSLATPKATAAPVNGQPVQLIDGSGLLALCREHKSQRVSLPISVPKRDGISLPNGERHYSFRLRLRTNCTQENHDYARNRSKPTVVKYGRMVRVRPRTPVLVEFHQERTFFATVDGAQRVLTRTGETLADGPVRSIHWWRRWPP
jgi:hypothetical protein